MCEVESFFIRYWPNAPLLHRQSSEKDLDLLTVIILPDFAYYQGMS